MSEIRRCALPQDNYTIVSNSLVNDSRLSPKARLMYIFMQSKPQGWKTSIKSLAEQIGISKDAVQSGLAELVEHCYLTVKTVRLGNGRLDSVYTLGAGTETRTRPENQDAATRPENQDGSHTGNQDGSHTGNQDVSKTYNKDGSKTSSGDSRRQAVKTRPELATLVNELGSTLKARGDRIPANPDDWFNHARLLIDRDKRDPDEALAILKWALADTFWAPNIKSMKKFRAQYDTLRHRSEGDRGARLAAAQVDWDNL